MDRIGEVALGQRRLRPQVQRLPLPLGMPRLQGGRRGAQRQVLALATPVAVVPTRSATSSISSATDVFDAFERSRRSSNHAQLFDLDAQSPGQKLDHLGRCGPTAALQMGRVRQLPEYRSPPELARDRPRRLRVSRSRAPNSLWASDADKTHLLRGLSLRLSLLDISVKSRPSLSSTMHSYFFRGETMRGIRKAIVAAATLLAVAIVPISAATQGDHAGGGGWWPQSVKFTKSVK